LPADFGYKMYSWFDWKGERAGGVGGWHFSALGLTHLPFCC